MSTTQPLIDRIPEWRALYNAALAADEAFQIALERQFSSSEDIGYIRYCTWKHNAETRQAGLAYQAASKALSNMNEFYRNNSAA